jgi:hypothetical protein
MFHRIEPLEWQHALAVVSFTLFFGVFIVGALRAAFMSKERVRHMENLPLNPDK